MATLPRTRDRSRDFDIILWGASGFTGRLVADYLVRNYIDGDTGLRLALAGRNKEKLEGIAKEVGAPQRMMSNSRERSRVRGRVAMTVS